MARKDREDGTFKPPRFSLYCYDRESYKQAV